MFTIQTIISFIIFKYWLCIIITSAEEVAPLSNETRLHPEEYAQMVSHLLDSILEGYDLTMRPNIETVKPAIIKIDIEVLTMGPISEQNMDYTMDCYFRQTWIDTRLQFNSTSTQTLPLGVAMLEKIWKPDTYFWNGQRSYLHTLTQPNRFVRLMSNGTIQFSSRLTIQAKCPMDLYKYPLDIQYCPLFMGSYAYDEKEMLYLWKKNLDFKEGLEVSQYALADHLIFNTTRTVNNKKFIILGIQFCLRRRFGYFLINFYGPCTLIVILSWVAFWINREATADRISLGVYSILTLTFLGLESRADLPRVTYPTALDIYFLACYSFLFGTILQFALVHAFTKYASGDPETRYLEHSRVSDNKPPRPDMSDTSWAKRSRKHSVCFKDAVATQKPNTSNNIAIENAELVCRRNASNLNAHNLEETPLPERHPYSNHRESKGSPGLVIVKWNQRQPNQHVHYDETVDANSVSVIDKIARVSFPVIFGMFNSLYWNTFLQEN